MHVLLGSTSGGCLGLH